MSLRVKVRWLSFSVAEYPRDFPFVLGKHVPDLCRAAVGGILPLRQNILVLEEGAWRVRDEVRWK